MRWMVIALAAFISLLPSACGGGSPPGAPQQQVFLGEGEFIDSKPITGEGGGDLDFPGDWSLGAIVSDVNAIVLVQVVEVVEVVRPSHPAPEGWPMDVIYGDPLTTYRARVEQWVKGDGPRELLITQFGGITESGPDFIDGFFLLEPGRAYVLTLYVKHPDVPTVADYVASVNGRSAFEVTDGFVHVLNHPLTRDLQEQYGGMPLEEFVEVLRDFVANPPPPPTPRPTPTPPPTHIDHVAGGPLAIETMAVGTGLANTATSLGAREKCSTLKKGETVTIDVTVDALPPIGDSGGGIIGFQFVLNYDPSVVKVAASDADMLLAANAGSSLYPLGDDTPDGDGTFLVAVMDFGQSSAPESGAGVLARITLEGVGAGVSALGLTDVIIIDSSSTPTPYTIDSVLAAEVAVDQPCPATP